MKMRKFFISDSLNKEYPEFGWSVNLEEVLDISVQYSCLNDREVQVRIEGEENILYCTVYKKNIKYEQEFYVDREKKVGE